MDINGVRIIHWRGIYSPHICVEYNVFSPQKLHIHQILCTFVADFTDYDNESNLSLAAR